MPPPPPGSTSRSQSPPSRSRSRHPSSNGNGNGNPSLSPSPTNQRGDSPYSLNGSASASASASPSSPVPYRYPSPYPFPRNNNPEVAANTSSNSNPNTTNTTSSPISPNSNSNTTNLATAAAGSSGYSNMYNPNPRRLSKDSDGYPSWLPRRPPPPAPASTLGQSSVIGGGNYSLRTGTPGAYTATGTGTPSPVDPNEEELIDVGPVNEFGELGYGHVDPFAAGGRKPTPRSVRIVTLQGEGVPGIVQPVEDTDFGFGNDDVGNEFGIATTSREPTDQTRVNFGDSGTGSSDVQRNHEGFAGPKGNFVSSSVRYSGHPLAPGKARTKPVVFSRSSLPPGAFLPAGYSTTQQLQVQLPRFNAKSLQLQFLLDPSVCMMLYWYVWPLLVLYHIPLQTYLDFGAVYMLIQVAKFPSSGPGSGKNWALGAAAYIACWLAWILFVCILYELVYSFVRRWRLRRPLILPIYLSAPAFNYAAMVGGYEMFCFLMYLRRGAWGREGLVLVDDGDEKQIRRSVLDDKTRGNDGAAVTGDEEKGGKKRRKKGGKKKGGKRTKTAAAASEGLKASPISSQGELCADEKRGDSTRRRTRTKRTRKSSDPTVNHSSSLLSDSSTVLPLTQRFLAYLRSRDYKQGIAETSAQHAQNLPSVLLLLPRAALCLALLFAFSSNPNNNGFTLTATSMRDPTYFRASTAGTSLTSYARGVLIANAAWTAWRVLVLILAYLGLWVSSGQRLAGLCGPRHGWEERKMERRRRRLSVAMGEEEDFGTGGVGGGGHMRDSFYYPGDRMSSGHGYSGAGGRGGAVGGKEKKRMSSMSGTTMMSGYGTDDEEREYGGDELAWKWREKTRARVQDAFEFCLNRNHPSSGSFSYGYIPSDRKSHDVPQALRWSASPVHPRSPRKGVKNAKERQDEVIDIPQEEIERVLAAAGFPPKPVVAGNNAPSPGRRKGLSRDLFDGPEGPQIAPIRYNQPGPGAATTTTATAGGKENVRLERPEMAKRASRDKIVMGGVGSAAAVGAADMYPFASPGAGYVSSKDSVPFPGAVAGTSGVRGQGSASGQSKSGSGSVTGTAESGSLEEDEEEEEDEDEDDEDEDDDEDDEDEDEDDEDEESDEEEESAPRTSASMSSLGQPISPSSRHPFGTVRRPAGAGHGRTMSGVSSALSSGGAHSHSHSHSHSMSVSSGGMDRSMVDSVGGATNIAGVGAGGGQHAIAPPMPPRPAAMPMPPRHPRGGSAGVRSRTNSRVGPSSSVVPTPPMPVAFPSVQNSKERERADSDTRGIIVDPAVLYAMQMGGGDEEQGEEVDEEEGYDVAEEREDQVGLLGIPTSAHTSRSNSFSISAASISTSDDPQSRSRSHSQSSRSRRSSARSRSRVHSSASNANPIRERASSLGASMRSIIQGAAASASASLTSLTQMDSIMRGVTGPAAGLGGGIRSKPRSRANSTMARLEEDVVFSPPPVQPHTPPMPSLPGPSYPPHQHTDMMLLGDVRRASGSSASGSNGSGSRNVSGGSHASSDAFINNPLSNSVSSNNFPNPLIGRLRRELETEEAGYSSGGSASGGSNSRGGNTHSRSGSESLSVISSVNGGGSNASANGDMNYTFGRPMSFMNPNRQSSQGQSSRLEDAEGILEELRRQSVPDVINQSVVEEESEAHEHEPGHGLLQSALRSGASSASLSMSFYSSQQQGETSTIAGSPPLTPTPAHMVVNIQPRSADDAASIQHTVTSEGGYLTPERTPEHSPERRGVPIPRSRVPSQAHQYHADQIPVIITTAAPAESNISSSPPGDISTAAASFVTAPATLLSATTSDSDALSERTVGISGSLSSGSDILPARVRRVSAQRRTDMVERAGEDMGAMGLGTYRVV